MLPIQKNPNELSVFPSLASRLANTFYKSIEWTTFACSTIQNKKDLAVSSNLQGKKVIYDNLVTTSTQGWLFRLLFIFEFIVDNFISVHPV